jgi:hypothetical protein
MADQWYYGSGDHRQGPFTDRQLRALADEGRIRPTDTIWKEGITQGVPAARVKNLLPPGAAQAGVTGSQASPDSATVPTNTDTERGGPERGESPAEAPSAPVEPSSTEGDGAGEAAAESTDAAPEQPAEQPAEEPAKPRTSPPPARKKGRAVALRGAVIASQDGETVIFSKVCVVCGFKETGRSRLPIRNGLTRANYFCPKCKKPRPVEIQGMP